MKGIIIGSCFLLLSNVAVPCDCIDGEASVRSLYEESTHLFSATVISVKNSAHYKEMGGEKVYYQDVELALVESFKGDTTRTLILVNQGFSNCGVQFEIGEEYLIFPFVSDKFNSFTVHQCHKRTATTARMQAELRELRMLKEKNGG